MRVTIIYSDLNFSSTFRNLVVGRPLLFGSGQRADFGVSGENIAPIHFQISFDGAKVAVKNLAASKAPLEVNGTATLEALLKDQDVVKVGGTEVGIRISGAPAPTAAAVAAAQPKLVFASEQLPSGLARWFDTTKECPLPILLDKLLAEYAPILVANFRAAGLAIPKWLEAEPDLLAGAGLAAEQSLHLIAATDPPPVTLGDKPEESEKLLAIRQLFDQLRAQQPAAMLLTAKAKAETAEAMKFHRGFFTTASSLELFLKQGSPELAHTLLAGAAAMLISDPGETSWSLYADGELFSAACLAPK